MSIAYFAHELADAAVQKRVRMLREAGENVSLLGFERDRGAPQAHSGAVLGQTRNGQFLARIASVAAAIPRALKLKPQWIGARLIIARNLEMLALVVALTRLAGVRPRIVYECLDIHRIVLGASLASWLVRAAERALLRRVDVVATSSPAFERNYFRAIQHYAGRVVVVENKVFSATPATAPTLSMPPPPWIIAWCGVLRCRRSFAILRALADAFPERVRIEMWGAPALDQVPDFHAKAARSPNMLYRGRYRPEELQAIYASAHFAWAVDFYEAGGNSDWLLPNRLYESLCFGAIPIAAEGVETASWLDAHKVGVVLAAPLEESLPAFIERLSPNDIERLHAAVASVPTDATRFTTDACRALVAELEGAP
ncbi:MAG: glycosyltransferase [Hyphomonadaceae bacterium]